jgi:hypothetical protein
MKIYENLIMLDASYKLGAKDVRFTGGELYPRFKGGRVYTSDPEIIKAMDNHPLMGKEFVEIKQVKKKEEPKLKEVSGINTVQKASDYLRENHEAKAHDVNNKEKVVAFAKKEGIVFPEL